MDMQVQQQNCSKCVNFPQTWLSFISCGRYMPKAEKLGLNSWWKSHIFWRDLRRTELDCPVNRWERLMARGSLRHNRFPVIVYWQEQRAKQAKMAEAGAEWPAKENLSIRVGALGEYRTYATVHKQTLHRMVHSLVGPAQMILIQAQDIQTSTQAQTWNFHHTKSSRGRCFDYPVLAHLWKILVIIANRSTQPFRPSSHFKSCQHQKNA